MKRRNGTEGAAASSAAVFGEVLKHYRELAGYTQEYLASLIPCDRSQVARIEAGTRVPQHTFAKKCDEVLGTGGVLGKLWGRIDWYPEVQHPDWFERRAEMDAEVVALREFQTGVMPGLLQTEDYAHALFSSILSGEEVDERVRARLSRQQRFFSPDGPSYMVVLAESCLHNAIGSPAVMYGQCAHLLAAGQRPNIRVQVALAADPRPAVPETSMSLIKLPDGKEWVYSESLDRGHFSDDPAVFGRHSQTYDVLRADVLSARDSAALIREVMGRYGQHGQPRTHRCCMDQEQLQRSQRRQLRGNRPRYPRLRPRA
ncbi:helix-turn-helix transcriptional regulator [Streptomyces sp. RS10V-4]|uniref:helix-turn-helix domain-containing protein n=1 Tax=Streptomyces rhizoryzae TaxID=2932493 RepID=UPI002003A792|nr:helix-turn-helix transcriptional regulator [Streptomyces rhizoryzae]MCK7624092.1 helix-turn-helix transcriptional regulator [Streptomyces rhizoryzae]